MLTAAVASFLVTWATLLVVPRTRLGRAALDVPNERSLHSEVVPRVGGIGIGIGIASGAATIRGLEPVLVWVAASYALLFLVSLVDDVRPLSVRIRLSVHLIAAAICTIALGVPPEWSMPATLSIVWAMNLFNFMDGADGLAGGMAIFGFAALAAAALHSGDLPLAALCASVAAASAAFLVFNVHPASLFMGDAGSIPLGFLGAVLGLYGAQQGSWPLLLPLLAFFPFVFDATYTLVTRVLQGHKPWEAHRAHLYQRLVRSGLGHRRMALFAYLYMLGCAACALVAQRLPITGQLAILGVVLVSSLLVAVRVVRQDAIRTP